MTNEPHLRRDIHAAAASILALLLIDLADYGLSVYWLSDVNTAHPHNSAALTGLWLWQTFTGLVTPLLGLLVARGLLAYLREAHGLSVPRWGWPAYAACLLIGLPGNVLPPLHTVLSYSGPLSAWLSDPARLTPAYAVLSALSVLSSAAAFAAAGLKVGLCVLILRALRRGVEPVLAAILAGLGMVTLVGPLGSGLSFAMQHLVDPQVAYSATFDSALNTFYLGFSLFSLLLLAALGGLLITSRHPGAAPA